MMGVMSGEIVARYTLMMEDGMRSRMDVVLLILEMMGRSSRGERGDGGWMVVEAVSGGETDMGE